MARREIPEGMELARFSTCQHVRDDGTVCGARYSTSEVAIGQDKSREEDDDKA